jgi:amino acid transporter
MSSPSTQVTTHVDPVSQPRSLWKHGVVAAVVASAATTVLAAVASAAGVSFADPTGASIPIA